MRRFYPVDTIGYLINLQWRRSRCTANGVLVNLKTRLLYAIAKIAFITVRIIALLDFISAVQQLI